MRDYFHAVPGRLRVRIAGIRDNPSLGNLIQEALSNIRGITLVSVRPITGSVIITYDPQTLNPNRILNHLADNDYIDLSKLSSIKPQLEKAVYRTVEVIVKAAISQAVSNGLKGSSLSIITSFL